VVDMILTIGFFTMPCLYRGPVRCYAPLGTSFTRPRSGLSSKPLALDLRFLQYKQMKGGYQCRFTNIVVMNMDEISNY
jgi:hypothetical protein